MTRWTKDGAPRRHLSRQAIHRTGWGSGSQPRFGLQARAGQKPNEEKLFKESTDPAKWTRDDTYSLAGRSIGSDELAAEHHQRMHAALEEELRHPTVSDADDHAGKTHEHESEGSGAESQSIRFMQGRAEYSIY
jgi:hypothetical protein